MGVVERHFLGWDGPVLPRAARWLRERFAPPGTPGIPGSVGGAAPAGAGGLDLSDVTIVVPTRRAGRRLLELLVEEVGDGALPGAPAIVTPGNLPERLYRCEDVADELACVLARVKVLRELSGDIVRQLTGDPPPPEDLKGWWALAVELSELSDQLAAEGLTPGDVAGESADPARWMLIAAIEEACAACLAAEGLVDCATARRRALEGGGCASGAAGGPIVLVGVADLSRLTARFLEAVEDRVIALIAAPEDEAAGFDRFGGLVVEHWAKRGVCIGDGQWVVADRPRDQARAVVEVIEALSRKRELSADEITVGLGDESLGPTVARALELAGAPARLAVGRAMVQTRPATLLGALGQYLRTRRVSDFAALLRHPDLPPEVLGAGEDVPGIPGAGDGLSVLDEYVSRHLQSRVTGAWLGEDGGRVGAMHDAVMALLPGDVEGDRSLPRWAQGISEILAKVYGGRVLRRSDPEDGALIEALDCLRGELDRLARIDEAGTCTPTVPLHGAIALLLEQLRGQSLPPASGELDAAVELVGFLELPLDDAGVVVVTGFNDGSIPSSAGSDPLLPGRLRDKLGVSGNERRLARDLYALTAVLAARKDVVLISGRRSAEGDPLTPSRLLLRCEPAVMAERLRRFYAEEHVASPPLLTPGIQSGPSGLMIPPPKLPVPGAGVLSKLRVTAFREYLACPYRFYLRYVLKLRGLDDEAVEMGGALFGDLAHAVLCRFGESDLAGETHAEPIAKFLSGELDREVRERFGEEPGAAIVLQREQLRERLAAFARWQAAQARAGWRIVREHVECRCEAELVVDGEPFTIVGTVDRIDLHETIGYRVIDYKTADAGDSPEKVHRDGPRDARRWIDLQLPLYRELARSVGCAGAIELGYVQLPRDVAAVGWSPGEWGEAELDDAVEQAREVVRAIRAGVFWPPAEPPRYEDEFTRLCYDRIIERAAAMAAGNASCAAAAVAGNGSGNGHA